MTTTVTKSIGTASRDYATHALWVAAMPSSLPVADQIWLGQSYNDAAFSVSSNAIAGISGVTTDSTHPVILDVGTGQGWNAVPATARYGATQSQGVLIDGTNFYAATLTADNCANFQLKNHQVTNSGGARVYEYGVGGSTDVITESCIFEGNASITAVLEYGIIRNSLFLNTGSSGTALNTNYTAVTAIVNCGFVRPSDITPAGTAVANNSAVLFQNCYSFGFTTFSNNISSSSQNNATDLSSVGGGTGNAVNVPFTTSTFNVTTNSGHDYRLVSGSALVDAGFTATIYLPAAVDAVGTNRPQGIAWDIGPHELIQSASDVLMAQAIF